jgi:hypothetical protein
VDEQPGRIFTDFIAAIRKGGGQETTPAPFT